MEKVREKRALKLILENYMLIPKLIHTSYQFTLLKNQKNHLKRILNLQVKI